MPPTNQVIAERCLREIVVKSTLKDLLWNTKMMTKVALLLYVYIVSIQTQLQ